MKNVILPVIVFCTTAITAEAQIKKGSTLLGGQIGVSAYQTDYEQTTPSTANARNTAITLSPSFGKAVKENFIIGTDVLYAQRKYENTSGTIKFNNYGIGLFVRFYKQIVKDFYFFYTIACRRLL